MPNSTTFKKANEYPAPSEPQTPEQWGEFLRGLEGKIVQTKNRLAKLAAECGNAALATELGIGDGLGRLTQERASLESQLEAFELALASGRSRLREAERAASNARESERLNKLASLKRQLAASAESFDNAAVLMKKALDSFYALTSDIHNLMTASEQANFLGCRSSVGPENSMGYHGLARPLGMAISARSLHHMSLSKYVAQWTSAPATPLATAPEPRDPLTYTSESEALSTPRPRSAS